MYRHWLRYSGHRASSGKKIRERNKKEAEGLFQQEQALRFSVSGCLGRRFPTARESCSQVLGLLFPAVGNAIPGSGEQAVAAAAMEQTRTDPVASSLVLLFKDASAGHVRSADQTEAGRDLLFDNQGFISAESVPP